MGQLRTMQVLVTLVGRGSVELSGGGLLSLPPSSDAEELRRLVLDIPNARKPSKERTASAAGDTTPSTPTDAVSVASPSVTQPAVQAASQDGSPRGSSSPSSSPDFEALFREALSAYVLRDRARALELFGRCAVLRPGDNRVQGNLRKLREMGGRP